ncbi:MAG: squalene/phytoene synthase family protein, partial [Novosphingobium sp.]
GAPEGMALAELARSLGIDLTHAQELLDAFVQDVTVNRYADWEALIGYCRNSAMPVGRFVLDVHGEDRAVWPLSDALCAALQIINHLQDCGKDYRSIDRVYVPASNLEAAGIGVEVLAEPKASPALRGVIKGLAEQTALLLQRSAPFAAHIRDRRLSAEVAVIQALAEDLVRLLLTRDPLSENVHHSKPRAVSLALRAIARNMFASKRA